MNPNELVRCTKTNKVGIILEVKNAAWAMMILVKWRDSTKWMESTELECLNRL